MYKRLHGFLLAGYPANPNPVARGGKAPAVPHREKEGMTTGISVYTNILHCKHTVRSKRVSDD
jgi:hypothetical protein